MPYTTIPELFAEACRERPRADCFSHKDAAGRYVAVSSTEAKERVLALRAALAEAGLASGDRVAIISENRVEWALVDLAVLSSGAVDVPIYPTLTAESIAYILKDCQPALVFLSNAMQAAKLQAVRSDLPFVRHVYSFDLPETTDITPFSELLARGRQLRSARPDDSGELTSQVAPTDMASIIYTSGTTGRPKGVMLSHGNFVSNVRAASAIVSIGPSDRCLSFLPLSHVLERMAGFYLMLANGIGIAYAEGVETVAQDMVAVRPTVMISVPRLYEKIYARVLGTALAGSPLKRNIFFWAKRVGEQYGKLERDGATIPLGLRLQRRLADRLVFSKLRARTGGQLRFFVSGGAPLGTEINEFFYAAGLKIMEGYGLTETSPVLAVNTFDHFRIGSVGPPVPGTEIRIAPDGEILARGPQIMLGYYNDPAATREVLGEDGWLATGDIGHIDSDGFLFITDRKKDLIVTAGGKNIAPQPLENELKLSRYVGQAVVIGDRRPYLTCLIVPNFETLGEHVRALKIQAADPTALIRSTEVNALYEREITRVNARLAGFEQIKRFALIDQEFTVEGGDLTPTMKVKRPVIQKKYNAVIDALYTESQGRS